MGDRKHGVVSKVYRLLTVEATAKELIHFIFYGCFHSQKSYICHEKWQKIHIFVK